MTNIKFTSWKNIVYVSLFSYQVMITFFFEWVINIFHAFWAYPILKVGWIMKDLQEDLLAIRKEHKNMDFSHLVKVEDKSTAGLAKHIYLHIIHLNAYTLTGARKDNACQKTLEIGANGEHLN